MLFLYVCLSSDWHCKDRHKKRIPETARDDSERFRVIPKDSEFIRAPATHEYQNRWFGASKTA